MQLFFLSYIKLKAKRRPQLSRKGLVPSISSLCWLWSGKKFILQSRFLEMHVVIVMGWGNESSPSIADNFSGYCTFSLQRTSSECYEARYTGYLWTCRMKVKKQSLLGSAVREDQNFYINFYNSHGGTKAVYPSNFLSLLLSLVIYFFSPCNLFWKEEAQLRQLVNTCELLIVVNHPGADRCMIQQVVLKGVKIRQHRYQGKSSLKSQALVWVCARG